ncbi:MAG: SpoIIE family protein phosphatase [Phycisphaerales bacterium]|nr:SpoIIE family protein phosphatase [Phycisphaerales bacterium]
MLREMLDMSLLEDFVEGLARAAGLRLAAYDGLGRQICESSALPGAMGHAVAPRELSVASKSPATAHPSPAHAAAVHAAGGHGSVGAATASLPHGADDGGAAHVAMLAHEGAMFVVAPVHLEDRRIGFVAVADGAAAEPGRDASERLDLSRIVVAARWAARLLSGWCRREARAHAAAEELALVGDIAELLTGDEDLQKILDHIVADTARVMRGKAASLRLYNPRTDELEMRAIFGLSPVYLNRSRIVRADNAIDDEALRGAIVAVDDMQSDPRTQYPEEARREGLFSALVAGMSYRGRPIGVLRVYTGARQRFRSAQRNLLRAVASQAATAIVHAQLIDERLRRAELERQVKLAGQVQARMIRTSAPRHPRIDAAWIFEPSQHVSGDFCDFLTLSDGRFAAAVADVAGKGVPASLLMGSVRGALRASARYAASIGEILTRLNTHVYTETAPHEFVTMLLCAIDDDARTLTYCSAGHEPLLLMRGSEVRLLDEGGLVLGIEPNEVYQAHAVPLEPGDFLLMCTDGVNEAMNFNQELFGRDRLIHALKSYRDANDTYQTLKNIVWDIRRFAGLAERSDDLTLVGLSIR